MDPSFIAIMDEIKTALQTIMNTKNHLTVPLSGTGSLGMEAAFVNTVERGDKVLVLQNGVFSTRMVDVATRLGAEVTELASPWGQPLDLDRVAAQLKMDDYKIVAMVYAETSTGVRNQAKEVGELLRGSDSLFLLDVVTALGGIPVEVDAWGVDICYGGSQKCLSCPPGVAPITFSERAVSTIMNRKSKVPNWYLDMGMLAKYWEGHTRVYHHTAPINMLYGFYQALYSIQEEGLDNVFARHNAALNALVSGLADMGWTMLVDEAYRLPMLSAVTVPNGVDEAALRKALLSDYAIEIGSGLGALAGKIVRIGLMGYNAQVHNVETLLGAMKEILARG
jgi:alanine-glyoxylate transaminase/serine-glyoxylate transaminase/serine-pyruvate transaminase